MTIRVELLFLLQKKQHWSSSSHFIPTMNSSSNSGPSSSYASSSTHANMNASRPPQLTNPFPLAAQTQGLQWGPAMSQNLHPLIAIAAQMQNNAWSPRIHPLMSQNHNSQTMPVFNTSAPMVPISSMQDTSPVGSSTDDDFLLAQVLLHSTDKGQTHKQAIEGLHGVSQISYCFWSPKNCG